MLACTEMFIRWNRANSPLSSPMSLR